jgi:hypothetical protein
MWQDWQATRATWRSGSLRRPTLAWPKPESKPVWQVTQATSEPRSGSSVGRRSEPLPMVLWAWNTWQSWHCRSGPAVFMCTSKWASALAISAMDRSPRFTPSPPPALAWHFRQLARVGGAMLLT